MSVNSCWRTKCCKILLLWFIKKKKSIILVTATLMDIEHMGCLQTCAGGQHEIWRSLITQWTSRVKMLMHIFFHEHATSDTKKHTRVSKGELSETQAGHTDLSSFFFTFSIAFRLGFFHFFLSLCSLSAKKSVKTSVKNGMKHHSFLSCCLFYLFFLLDPYISSWKLHFQKVRKKKNRKKYQKCAPT